mmetsp:Transcript_33889/g.74171  ORF Transcript_33889/g.74171 Transcript_33889/m.74171 type:complete len:288 (+) Transcript_33889:3763-4626(+)
MIFFAASLPSTEAQSLLHFISSASVVLRRVWYLMKAAPASVEASLPLDSICCCVTNFLAADKASSAVCRAVVAASAALRISAAELWTSFESSSSTAAASTTFLPRASAFATSLSASCTIAFRFLSAVALFSLLSRFMCDSSCDWYSLSFTCASWPTVAEKRRASTSLVAMNIRPMDTAVPALVAAVSQVLTAARVSFRGSSSMPMRKGPSASAALAVDSSTPWSFSAASARSAAQVRRSLASLWVAFSCVRRCCEARARSSSFLKPSRTAGADACVFWSMKFRTVPM